MKLISDDTEIQNQFDFVHGHSIISKEISE